MEALSVFWTFLVYFTVSAQCCELVQNGFFRENGDCAPCQEEKVAYFGNNIKVSLLEICFLDEKIKEFWSFKAPLLVNILPIMFTHKACITPRNYLIALFTLFILVKKPYLE